MKILGYLLMAAGVVWALMVTREANPAAEAGAPAATLLGIGFGFLTAHSARTGSIRGRRRRIRRDEQPTLFWIVVAIWSACAATLLVGGLLLFG